MPIDYGDFTEIEEGQTVLTGVVVSGFGEGPFGAGGFGGTTIVFLGYGTTPWTDIETP